MFYVDVLSAYLICGVSALVGAAMLRIAETDEPNLRLGLRLCGWSLVMFGLGLLPAGLGGAAAHPAAQFALGFGSLAGMVLMAHGFGQMQGRRLSAVWLWALLTGMAVAIVAALAVGPLVFGRVYSPGLAGAATLMVWHGRGFVSRPRNLVERGLGLTLLLVMASSVLRLGFMLAYAGPPRVDMLYVPASIAAMLAAMYGVLPIMVATLLLSMVNARLQHLLHTRASTDELTGMLTRRALRELAPATIASVHHGQREVAVLMVDLDHFKAINDTDGHAKGDKVLRLVAATLQTQLRHDALLARYGGEEFVAVLPVDDVLAARRASERLRLAVEGVAWSRDAGVRAPVTTSIGVALVGHGETLDSALQRADEALYRAKRDGRNQVQISLSAA